MEGRGIRLLLGASERLRHLAEVLHQGELQRLEDLHFVSMGLN